MSKEEKAAIPDLDVSGLLALKTYERPDAKRTEKNIQNIMREVRTTSNVPSLLLFPDKSAAWMFAQPRYGVAALFIIFLGLHLLDHPLPAVLVGPVAIHKEPGADIMAAVDTNRLKAAAVPGLTPAYSSPAGEPGALSSFVK